MMLEDILEEIRLLENKANRISDVTDSLRKELEIHNLLVDYVKVHPKSVLEHYVKVILMTYLVNKDPFPLLTKEIKIKPGAPKRNISKGKISYYLFNTNGSIRKTSQLLQIDRKTVISRYEHAQEISKSFRFGEYTLEKIEAFSRYNDNLFLDDFNADVKRFEKKSKKK
mgnify:CR=1 FL=1